MFWLSPFKVLNDSGPDDISCWGCVTTSLPKVCLCNSFRVENAFGKKFFHTHETKLVKMCTSGCKDRAFLLYCPGCWYLDSYVNHAWKLTSYTNIPTIFFTEQTGLALAKSCRTWLRGGLFDLWMPCTKLYKYSTKVKLHDSFTTGRTQSIFVSHHASMVIWWPLCNCDRGRTLKTAFLFFCFIHFVPILISNVGQHFALESATQCSVLYLPSLFLFDHEDNTFSCKGNLKF